MNVDVTQYENRAMQAEKQIEALTKRLEQLESKGPKGSSDDKEFKTTLLETLRDIRKDLVAANEKISTLEQDNKKLKVQLKEREAEAAKQDYRIKHLLLSLQEGDKAEYRVKHLLRALDEEEHKQKA